VLRISGANTTRIVLELRDDVTFDDGTAGPVITAAVDDLEIAIG
jgi:hypothetical protein